MARKRTATAWVKGASDSLSPRAIVLYGVLSAATVILMGRHFLDPVLHGQLLNPDSYMRLVRIEATLHAHHIMDVVPRDGSGSGTLLYWSHLLDSLIILLSTPLGLVLTSHDTVRWAAVAVGPLSMTAVGAAAAWAAAPFATRRWLWLAPVLLALSPSVAIYGLPGVAHHHVLLVLCAIMAAAWAVRLVRGLASAGGAIALGAWAGLGIWISPESMPFVLFAFCGVWLAWLIRTDGEQLARAVALAGVSFLVVIAAAFAVDPPDGGYGVIEIDRLSIVYLALAMAVCGAGCATWLIQRLRLTPPWRTIIAITFAALCAARWLACFPAVLLGPDALMDAADARAFFGSIIEMQPVATAADAIQYLLDGAVAAGTLCWLAWRQRAPLLAYAGLGALAAVALGGLHVRFAAYPTAVAAVMLPIIITRCEVRDAARASPFLPLARAGLVALFLLTPRADILPAPFAPALASEAPPARCAIGDFSRYLTPYAGQVVMALPTDTPELLYRTDAMTTGSFYHHNYAALRRLRAAWRSAPSTTEPEAVRDLRAAAILICPQPGRSSLVDDLQRDTLLDQLTRHAVPPWLHQVATDPVSGYVLYRVAP